MYQVAFIESLGEKFGMDVCYPNFDSHIEFLRGVCDWTRHAEEYRSIFKNVDFHKNKQSTPRIVNNRYIDFYYEDITPQSGDHFHGYFQSEKYFYSKQFIKWLFEPSDIVSTRLDAYKPLFNVGTTCSIHVRRGNYLQLESIHPPLNMEYYNRAMGVLEDMDDVDMYLIFSNDIEWCKQNFTGDRFVFIQDTDYIELYLGSMCTHHILANSSFSTWMAILGERDASKVICPGTEDWFGPELPYNYARDIVPNRWIQV
jgi:hypothetical protein